MKISADGGALNPKDNKRFGTAVFSENLVKALQLYDKENQYLIYTFNNLKPKLFWLKGRVSLEEFKQKKDVFLALNQAVPLFTAGKVISFCHGLSYHFYPELYSKKDVIRLNKQLKEMVKRSDEIIVSSEKIKNELTSMLSTCLPVGRYIEDKIIILPFGIPFDMEKRSSFVKTTADKQKYFLYVGMNHPIKNIEFIKNAFTEFKKNKKYSDFKLYILTKNISRKKLKRYYQQATALLTASHYESFNFPVLEALSQGCPVVGLRTAIIPELQPYVNLADSTKVFVENMTKISKKPNVQSINQLYKKFNWKNYVNNLVKLY